MLLSDLFPEQAGRTTQPTITGVTADSRAVKDGMVFVAIKGETVDGHDFIDDAIKAGAAAIVAERNYDQAGHDQAGQDQADHSKATVPVIISGNSRLSLSQIAASLAGHQPGVIVAVTGTNGKTSVADFLRQIWEFTGWSSASMGTLGIKGADGIKGDGLGQISDLTNLTTPDPVTLHHNLAKLAKHGVTNLAMEASSHGIEQDRLSGVRLVAAGFTNLSRDHLDYHQDMEAYFAAKTRLFTELLPEGGMAVINIDDDYGQRLVKIIRDHDIAVLTIGTADDADLKIVNIDNFDGGMTIAVTFDGKTHVMPVALMGGFQAENALMAAGLAYAAGLSMPYALMALPRLVAAPGRMQVIDGLPNGGKVVVDFAHTPDALKTVLASLRGETPGQLGVVFGCGGDRDDGKRAEMGAIAKAHADFTIITDDNPRNEDPAQIRAMIRSACPQADEIGDRHQAITEGINRLGEGDLLLIAGKGHESNQLVGSETLPFNDEGVARNIISKLRSEV